MTDVSRSTRLLALLALLSPVFIAGTMGVAQNGLVRFTGQLLDVRDGYVYFSTGDAFRLAPGVRYTNYETGAATTQAPHAKMYARAILDPETKQVVELDITGKHLAQDVAFASTASSFTATKAVTQRAPEIVGVPLTGREVAVEFVVTVPPTTPLNASIYISTDVSNWDPQAIKLDRVDGQRYRAVRRFASGTKFAFRVTRGSWNSVELGENGLEQSPHRFSVAEVDAQSAKVVVYQWSDNRGNRPESNAAQPGAIPTPFTDTPFGPNNGFNPVPLPSGYRPPGGQPTPPPNQQNPPNRPPH